MSVRPEVLGWLNTNAAAGNAFATSLLGSIHRYGNLTPNQEAAVLRSLAREQTPRPQPQAASVAGEGFRALLQSFAAARQSRLKWPKLTCGSIRFSLAGDQSKNPGCVYVKTHHEDRAPELEAYLGKITASGDFYRSRDCDDAQAAHIVSVGRDPLGEAIRHGKETGHCAICSRKLTDPESVTRGIGPTCAKKYGW